MFLLAIEHQLDRCLRRPGQPGADEPLCVGTKLAAETAAHELGDHADVRLRNLQATRETLTRPVDGLRRHPGREVLAVPFAQATVGFERHMRLHLRRVGALDDVSGTLEAGLDVTLLFGVAPTRVALLEDFGGLRAHGLFDGGQVRKHLPVDLDQANGIFRLLLGDGGHGGNLLAGVHHLLAGFDGCQDRPHPRRLLRRRDVNAPGPRVRVRRAQNLAVNHSRARNVVGILRAPGGFQGPVNTAHSGAQQPRLLRPGILLMRGRSRWGLDFGHLIGCDRCAGGVGCGVVISHGPLPWP